MEFEKIPRTPVKEFNDPNTAESSKDGIGSVATDFLTNTSAHGLPRIAGAKSRFRRVFWAFIFFGCFTGFSIQTYRTFREYLQFPVTVTTTVKPSKMLEFPAVTVCNMNMIRSSLLHGTKYAKLLIMDSQFSKSELWDKLNNGESVDYSQILDESYDFGDSTEADGTTEAAPGGTTVGATSEATSTAGPPARRKRDAEMEQDKNNDEKKREKRDAFENYDAGGDDYSSKFNYEDYGFGDITDETQYDKFLEKAKTADLSDLSGVLNPTKAELRVLGHQAEDFILQCSFDKTPCNYSEFYVFQNAFFGNCFTFNHGQGGVAVKNTTKYGSRFGLRLTLNSQADDYTGMFSPTVGARVSIHSVKETPLPQDSGVDVMPGSETSIGLQVEDITRLIDPHPSNCTNGVHKSGKVFEVSQEEGNYSYSLLACRLTCYSKSLFERCGCYDKVTEDSTSPRCSILNRTQETCRQKTKHAFDNFKLGCDCPQSCYERHFSKTISAGSWPSTPYKNLLRRNIDGALIDNVKNLLRVHVYFEGSNIREIKEVGSYTDEQLAANIGGNLGLFIGISICTAVEFIEFVIDGIAWVCCRSKRTNVVFTN